MSERNLSSVLTRKRAMTIWDFEDIFDPLRYICPHCALRRLDLSWHPGTSGTAEILAEYNRRKGDLIQDNSLDRIPALGPSEAPELSRWQCNR